MIMRKIYLDTNFIMDLLAREDENTIMATKVVEKGKRLNLKFYISFLSVANFAYITRKQSKEILYSNLDVICELFDIESNDENQIIQAKYLDGEDFEDAIQYETAIKAGCECILTRNERDFHFAKIPVLTPSDFLKTL